MKRELKVVLTGEMVEQMRDVEESFPMKRELKDECRTIETYRQAVEESFPMKRELKELDRRQLTDERGGLKSPSR